MAWLTAGTLVPALARAATPGGPEGAEGPEGPEEKILAPSPPAEPARPTLRAVRAVQPPLLDGVIEGDPAWAGVAPATGFTQTEPDAGAPASERTEVRVIFTDDTLYVGVTCFDSQPAGIITTDARRDAALDGSDAFYVVFDTYRDRHNGFVFATNPLGAEYDGQVLDEGGGGSTFTSSSLGGFNRNWDGSWTVRTRVGDLGWTAEFAIPFRTLRYPGTRAQEWGVNFRRNIRRRNEISYWAPLPRQFTLNRVSLAGNLEGLAPPVHRNLLVIPYVLREASRDAALGSGWDGRADGGVDLKYSLTSSLTLDATVGTDFSQVEADAQQVNLNRFNLFFPEKRPFFLENAGIFAVGRAGLAELFFTRRIGLGPDGERIPIVAGARMSGKAGNWRVGVLDMQTEALGATTANNFGVARVGYELPHRSAIGILLVNRQATSGPQRADDFNRTAAIDGRLGLGEYFNLSGFLAGTDTGSASPGAPAPAAPAAGFARLLGRASPLSYNVTGSYDSPGWIVEGSFLSVGERFNPEVGFLRRENFYASHLFVMHRYRPADLLGFQELRPHAQLSVYNRTDGEMESVFHHFDNHWQWRNGYQLNTGFNLTGEQVFEPFEIHPGVVVPVGRYSHGEGAFAFHTNPGAAVALELDLVAGGFFGGKRLSTEAELTVRFGDRFSGELEYERDRVELPVGAFTANLVRTRLSYSFTSRLALQALLQYNDQENVWATNLRLAWYQSAGAGFFVVYNENLDTTAVMLDAPSSWRHRLGVRSRALVAKLSLVFDVL